MQAKRLFLQALLVISGALCLAPFVWSIIFARRLRAVAESMQQDMRGSDPLGAMTRFSHDAFFLSFGGWLLGIVGAGLFIACFFALRRLPAPEPAPPPLPPGLG